jgi:peroxiredoxin Q/BCP
VALQQKFIDTNALPMALLADTEMKLIKELGIRNGASGKTPKRVTFVVDKNGKIAKIYDKVDVNMHPKEVLDYAKTLK